MAKWTKASPGKYARRSKPCNCAPTYRYTACQGAKLNKQVDVDFLICVL